MTIIRATCPTCGTVELPADAVRLVVNSMAERSFYAFTCVACGDRVNKPAGDEVIRLLTAGGLVAERIDTPAEALEEPVGPPLSWDDALDFSAWLNSGADIAAAFTAASRH